MGLACRPHHSTFLGTRAARKPNASRMSRVRRLARALRRSRCSASATAESDGALPFTLNPTTEARGAGAGVGSIR
jgi:hypothetical protein